MLLLLPCFTIALLCVVQAMPPGWEGTPEEVDRMMLCGADIFNVGNVNVQSIKMRCENETGFDEMMFYKLLMGMGKRKHHMRGMPMPEGEGEPWAEGEGEPWAEGEDEPWAEGEGEPWAEGESEPWAEGEREPWAEGEGEPWAEGEGEPWAEGEGWPEPEGEGEPWAEPEGLPYSLIKKMCKFGESKEESDEDESSEEDFEEDESSEEGFGMDDVFEAMKPEKIKETMGKMKKKMMKMKCSMMMMMMMKRKKMKMMKMMMSLTYLKKKMTYFKSEIRAKQEKFELCKGKAMGYMDGDNNILRDALKAKIEEKIIDNEPLKNTMIDRLDACIENHEPKILYMCVKMKCMKSHMMFGKKYKCVEQ